MFFAMDASGMWVAYFDFAGGAARGQVLLPGVDARTIEEHDAYVADVRLGTYEQGDAGQERSALTCGVNPTYHFFCPTTDAVDQFCIAWLPAKPDGQPVEAAGRASPFW